MKYQGKRDASHCQINNLSCHANKLSTFVQFAIHLKYLKRRTVHKMQSFSDKDSTFTLDLFKSLHSRNIILTKKTNNV